MTDTIQERLRYGRDVTWTTALGKMMEAADEIDRLERDYNEARDRADRLQASLDNMWEARKAGDKDYKAIIRKKEAEIAAKDEAIKELVANMVPLSPLLVSLDFEETAARIEMLIEKHGSDQ